MITREQLLAIAPNSSDFYDALVNVMYKYDIDNVQRQAAFLAQITHESGYFKHVEENLNYSVQGLLATFPKYFNQSNVSKYARKPQAIANRVYANRMGNGSEQSGDGWKYRGRGLIQLTGKNNYLYCDEDTGIGCSESPEVLSEPEGACESAGWFWKAGGLNELADQGGMKGITKRINGGYIGLNARMALYEKYLSVL